MVRTFNSTVGSNPTDYTNFNGSVIQVEETKLLTWHVWFRLSPEPPILKLIVPI